MGYYIALEGPGQRLGKLALHIMCREYKQVGVILEGQVLGEFTRRGIICFVETDGHFADRFLEILPEDINERLLQIQQFGFTVPPFVLPVQHLVALRRKDSGGDHQGEDYQQFKKRLGAVCDHVAQYPLRRLEEHQLRLGMKPPSSHLERAQNLRF